MAGQAFRSRVRMRALVTSAATGAPWPPPGSQAAEKTNLIEEVLAVLRGDAHLDEGLAARDDAAVEW